MNLTRTTEECAVDMDLGVSKSLADSENDGEEKMSAGLVALPSVSPAR